MMKMIFSALVIAVAFASAPAFAQNTSTSNTNTTTNTTAAAMLQGGNNYSGSVGAANCAWAVNLGPLGTSQMADICKRDIASTYWAKRGRMDIADEIMLQSPITKAAVKVLAARTAKAVSTSTKSAPVDLKAVVRAMSAANRAAYEACTVMQVGEVRFKKSGC